MTIILQHELETPAGTAVDWLNAQQMPFKICKLYEENELPVLEDFESLIICGGSMNVDQEEKFAWLKNEKELIKQAIQAKKKIVGLCLGSQLIAEVLGAEVGPMNYSEVGWQPVSILKNDIAGTNDLQLAVFQWHSYYFKSVPGAKEFGFNKAWKHQAFTFDRNVMAFQFHPETTLAWASECADDNSLPTGEFCQTASQIKAQLHLQKLLQEWFFKTLDAFFHPAG